MTTFPTAVAGAEHAPARSEGLSATANWPAALVLAQFGAVIAVISTFRLETPSLVQVLLLALAGFAVQAVLPLAWRLPFFSLLSIASIGVVFGVVASLWLLCLGGVLIAICHLPVSFRIRVVLLLAAGTLLAGLRADWVPNQIPDRIWPILGAMFMFRLALYVYSIRFQDAPTGPVQAAAYFFMLPNACFPLFPVVDYKNFTRNFRPAPDPAVWERGLEWIVRGVVHLLLYRLVYHHLTLDASQVTNLGQLIQFVIAAYLLYLRVSGQFHLIVGVLHLFGFDLPETHHLYYLASSFNDFWRRINIYWKDFMMKLVYYPSFFRLRRFGTTTALVGSTIIVFVGTWLLHSYQWFWLLGDFPVTGPDLLFWGILGVLVVVNALREASRVRRPLRPSQGWSLALALRTLGTFVAISVLWSLWTSDSVHEWWLAWRAAGVVHPRDLLLLAGLLGFGLLIAGWPWGAVEIAGRRAAASSGRSAHQAARRFGVLGALYGLTLPAVHGLVSPSVAGVLVSLQETKLNNRDAERLHQGYYEKLNSSKFNSQVWGLTDIRPTEWLDLRQTGSIEQVPRFVLERLKPSVSIVLKGEPFNTNRWGMRDREVELAKPAGTVRIAVVGPSDVMGSGVADSAVFTRLLEQRLNAALTRGSHVRYQVLNFSSEGYSPLQQLALLEELGLRFQPNVVLFAAHESDWTYDALSLKAALKAGITIPDSALRRIVDSAGITAGMEVSEIRARLEPWKRSVFELTYARLASVTAAAGAHAAVVLFRLPTDRRDSVPELRAAVAASQLPLYDLSNIYPELAEPTYRVAQWDHHPNPAAHQLIATRLSQRLTADRLLLGLEAK